MGFSNQIVGISFGYPGIFIIQIATQKEKEGHYYSLRIDSVSCPTSDTLQALNIQAHPSVFNLTHRRVSERFWMLFDLRQLWNEELQFRTKSVWDLSMFTLGIWPFSSQWHIFTLIPKTRVSPLVFHLTIFLLPCYFHLQMDPAYLIGPVICKLIWLCPVAHPSPKGLQRTFLPSLFHLKLLPHIQLVLGPLVKSRE